MLFFPICCVKLMPILTNSKVILVKNFLCKLQFFQKNPSVGILLGYFGIFASFFLIELLVFFSSYALRNQWFGIWRSVVAAADFSGSVFTPFGWQDPVRPSLLSNIALGSGTGRLLRCVRSDDVDSHYRLRRRGCCFFKRCTFRLSPFVVDRCVRITGYRRTGHHSVPPLPCQDSAAAASLGVQCDLRNFSVFFTGADFSAGQLYLGSQ